MGYLSNILDQMGGGAVDTWKAFNQTNPFSFGGAKNMVEGDTPELLLDYGKKMLGRGKSALTGGGSPMDALNKSMSFGGGSSGLPRDLAEMLLRDNSSDSHMRFGMGEKGGNYELEEYEPSGNGGDRVSLMPKSGRMMERDNYNWMDELKNVVTGGSSRRTMERPLLRPSDVMPWGDEVEGVFTGKTPYEQQDIANSIIESKEPSWGDIGEVAPAALADTAKQTSSFAMNSPFAMPMKMAGEGGMNLIEMIMKLLNRDGEDSGFDPTMPDAMRHNIPR